MLDNPQAVRFCNEKIRPLADHFCQLYFELKTLAALWQAQGIGALIPNDPTVVNDGAAVDGRAPITGIDVNNVATRAIALIADFEADGDAHLRELLRVAVNPER